MNILKQLKFYIDKKLLYLIIGFYGAFTLFSLSKMIYFKSIGDRFSNKTWSYMFFEIYLTDYLLVIFFMSFVLVITKYIVQKKWHWTKVVSIHLILSILLGLFIFFGIVSVQYISGAETIQTLDPKTVIYYYMNVIDLNFLIYFSLVGIIHTYYYLSKVNEKEVQEIFLKEKLSQTKMKLLQSQIRPHFLFNTLNSIHALMDIDKAKSKDMLVDLSNLLREILEFKTNNLITLQQELNMLQKYLDIMLVRFSGQLTIATNIEDNIGDALVPSMLIQPIAENSFKHGFSNEVTQLHLIIDVYREQDLLVIKVANNGCPISLDSISKGNGLENTYERLKELYSNDFEFHFGNNTEKTDGVVTKIVIPYQVLK